MSWISIGAAAVSAFGQYQSGQAAKAQGNLQAGQLNYQGSVEQQNAMQQAEMIRRQQRYAVGRSDVAAAGSGIVVGEGSAGEADRQIYQDSEHDAYQAILSGNRKARSLSLQASGARAAGDMAATNADEQAFGTVLGGAYQGLRGSGWRTGGMPGYSGTQSPAPVTDRSLYYPKG